MGGIWPLLSVLEQAPAIRLSMVVLQCSFLVPEHQAHVRHHRGHRMQQDHGISVLLARAQSICTLGMVSGLEPRCRMCWVMWVWSLLLCPMSGPVWSSSRWRKALVVVQAARPRPGFGYRQHPHRLLTGLAGMGVGKDVLSHMVAWARSTNKYLNGPYP